MHTGGWVNSIIMKKENINFLNRIEIFTNIIFGILKHLQKNIPVKLCFYLYLILKQKVSDIFNSNLIELCIKI